MKRDFSLYLPHVHADQQRANVAKQDLRHNDMSLPELEREAWQLNAGGRYKAIRCGRRWGKTTDAAIIASETAAAGKLVGWFAPGFKYLSEAYAEIADYLASMRKAANKEKFIRTLTNGRIDFWSLENEDAGRSRKYDLVVIDEAAFGPVSLMNTWRKSIKPTLLDRGGRALVVSNTKGVLPDNFFYKICTEPEHGFITFHAPTINNPTIPESWTEDDEARCLEACPEIKRLHNNVVEYRQAIRDWLRAEEIAKLQKTEHPLVFKQEYGAEFVDWNGDTFFDKAKLLHEGNGVPMPTRCDYVFAVIDSATKTGTKNDGTAVTYWARQKFSGKPDTANPPLILLDWDIVQIQGDLLPNWLDVVFQNLEALALKVGARHGSMGAHIEDKASGMVLIMAAQRRGKKAHAIPSVLTSVGKDERAIAVSGYVYRGEVKMSQPAYDKLTMYKGSTANHFLLQVCNFRIGVENQSDDLLDSFTYSVAIALGDRSGI